MIYIYALRHPITKEVRYVGQTANLEQRLYAHCHTVVTDTYKHRWIRLLRRQQLFPEMVVLEAVSDGVRWEDREIYWISEMKKQFPNLTNTALGGQSCMRGRQHSLEAKLKIQRALKGRPLTPENLKNLRIAKKRPVSEETRQLMSFIRKGRPSSFLSKKHSSKTKHKISLKKLGSIPWNKGKRLLNEKTRALMSQAHLGKPSPRRGATLTKETKSKIRASLKRWLSQHKKEK